MKRLPKARHSGAPAIGIDQKYLYTVWTFFLFPLAYFLGRIAILIERPRVLAKHIHEFCREFQADDTACR